MERNARATRVENVFISLEGEKLRWGGVRLFEVLSDTCTCTDLKKKRMRSQGRRRNGER